MLTGLNLLIPEFFLIGLIILSLGCAVFTSPDVGRVKFLSHYIFLPCLALITSLLVFQTGGGFVFAKELLVIDGQTQFAKFLILALTSLTVFLAGTRLSSEESIVNPHKVEYFSILMISSLGMMVMVSANDLITFYLGLEIQSLALYIMIAFRRADALATEASLKYLVLGAVASGLFLFGTSLVFGMVGSIHYQDIHSFAFMSGNNILFLIGFVLILTTIFFKLSAAPFHMWTPDVYQGSPIFVTSFVAVIPKIATVFALMRMIGYAFEPVGNQYSLIMLVISGLSLIIGAVMAVRQNFILRMFAYSTVTHMGYIILGLVSEKTVFNQSVAEYSAIYSLTNFGLFCFLASLKVSGRKISDITDFAGMGSKCPKKALLLTIMILSLAGIPPLAGFFIKFGILDNAIEAGFIIPSIIAIIASAISAFYYLKVIKIIYFDEPQKDTYFSAQRKLLVVSAVIACVLLLYVFNPQIMSSLIGDFIVRYGSSL